MYMVLLGSNRVRSDVFDESLDEALAPSLGGVVLRLEHPLYLEPSKFFNITLVTEQFIDILENVVNVLTEGKGHKIVILSALFGGGKTHTLISLYHVLREPPSILNAVPENDGLKQRVRDVVGKLRGLKDVGVVVIDGQIDSLSPSPLHPLSVGTYVVRTLWGYIAHSLGSYSYLREFDEKLTPPGADTLAALFKGKKVVILVDEIARYVKTLYSSGDEGLRRYARVIDTFFEALAKAIDVSKHVILVISLPLIAKGDTVDRLEKAYDDVALVLGSLFRALRRVASYIVEPIAPKNVPTLLKVRLFESVDTIMAHRIAQELGEVFKGDHEVFDNSLAGLALGRVVEYYPFHPLYVDVLKEVLELHEGLQKTRDLLRITRKVLRKVVRDVEGYGLVMPWHIDLTDDSMAAIMLSSYDEFRSVVHEDVEGRTRTYEKYELSKMVANTVLLKTFTYSRAINVPPGVYPTAKEVAVMVYEPNFFRSKGFLPKDIIDAANWLRSNLIYLLDDDVGRMWFTFITTPQKYVEDYSRRIELADAEKKLIDLASRLVFEVLERGSRGRRIRSKVFSESLSRVSRDCEPLDYDSPEYVLYACVNLPDDRVRRDEMLVEVMYRTRSGGSRRYRNTIYVTYPNERGVVIEALENVKKLIACERVEREGIIDRVVTSRKEVAEILREVFKSKLRRYCDERFETVLRSILNIFNVLSYPILEGGRDWFKTVDVHASKTSIVLNVEEALQRIQPRKYVESLDFDTLNYYLQNVGVDLEKLEIPKKVRDIIDYFYSNPYLPIVLNDEVKKAIAEGVKKLYIGLRCDGRIIFKKVNPCRTYSDCLSIAIAEGEDVDRVSDECEVLGWGKAIEEQMMTLISKPKFVGDKVIEYLVMVGKELVKVEEVLNNLSKYNLNVLRSAPLLLIESEAKLTLKPEVGVHEVVKPGVEVVKEFTLEKLGPYRGRVFIRSNIGKIRPPEIVVDDGFSKTSITWTFLPSHEGTFEDVLRVVDEVGKTISSVKIVVEAREFKVSKSPPPPGTHISKILLGVSGLNLRPLKVLRDRFRGVVVERGGLELVFERGQRRTELRMDMAGADIDDFFKLVQSIASQFGVGNYLISIKATIIPSTGSYIVMPEIPENEINELKGYVEFYLR